ISKSYVDGIVAFTDYVVHNLQKTGNIDPRVNKKHIYIPCPCTKCLNHIEHKVEELQYHLYRHGIDISYTNWTKHREEDEPSISSPKPVNAMERITKKRTKNEAKTTKPDSEWKSCEGQSQSKAKDQISQSQLNKSTVKTKAVIEEYYWLQSQPI
ncbi:retrovirus-related pol polyprotein from transposon TNT 1-94, partial [Tanacetum coccineum]